MFLQIPEFYRFLNSLLWFFSFSLGKVAQLTWRNFLICPDFRTGYKKIGKTSWESLGLPINTYI